MPGNDGDEVWAAYTKGVKPIKPERRPASSRHAAKKSSLSRYVAGSGARHAKISQARPTDFHAPLERNLEGRLRQGSITLDARLDLHGMRQDEAHKALERFMAAQVKSGRRYLLIITGKGRCGEGVLRAGLDNWLAAAPVAAHILALRPAAVRHGGGGAFYVVLKRQRD